MGNQNNLKYILVLIPLLFFLLALPFSIAQATYSNCAKYGNCEPVSTTVTFNNNSGSVNNSIYWQGHTGTDGSWLTGISTANSTYDAKADYNFGANNFNGSGNFTTSGNVSLGQKVTFTLGQIIDGITAGWIKITGSLWVTGGINTTSINGTSLNITGISDSNIDNSTFFVDATNHRIGIGIAKPTAKLHINDTSANSLYVSNALFVDGSSRRVGIGISTPTQMFDINDSVDGRAIFSPGGHSNSAGWFIGETGSANDGYTRLLAWRDAAGFTLTNNYNPTAAAPNGDAPEKGTLDYTSRHGINIVGVSAATSHNTYVSVEFTNATASGTVQTNPVTKFFGDGDIVLNNTIYINRTGNVGIGTATPLQKLNVIGNSNITGTLNVQTGNSENQAICWKVNGLLGYCSTAVNSTGGCTCN